MKKGFIALAIIICFGLYGILSAITVDADDDFEVDFECIDIDSEVVLTDTTLYVYSNDQLVESITCDANGIITLDTGNIQGFNDEDVLEMKFSSSSGDYFDEFKEWRVSASWAQLESIQICMQYMSFTHLQTNDKNEEKVHTHHFSGFDSTRGFAEYRDDSTCHVSFDNIIYYPDRSGLNKVYIEFKSHACGIFNAEDMDTGYEYKWRITFKMWLEYYNGNKVTDVQGKTADQEIKISSRDNTNGDATTWSFDPDLSLTFSPVTAPPNTQGQEYELHITVKHNYKVWVS